jgi:hypothetical protein
MIMMMMIMMMMMIIIIIIELYMYNMVSNLNRRKLGFISAETFYACSKKCEEWLLASSCVPGRTERRGSPGMDIH